MTLLVQGSGPLGAGPERSTLFRDWLAGALGSLGGPPAAGSAQVSLDAALADVPAPGPAVGPVHGAAPDAPGAPLFGGQWIRSYLAEVGPDLLGQDPPGPASLARLTANLETLRQGRARTVVTGQQPGFLGGPLYTLFKIATAIALAERRTAAGNPTFPVFWMGDDDTDLREALAPVGWDFGRAQFLRSEGLPLLKTPAYRGRTAGSLETAQFSGAAAAWMNTAARGASGDLGSALARLHGRAAAQNWSLGRLMRAVVFRVFCGSDLIVVAGDDPGLHAAGAPFSEVLRRETETLARLARERGRRLQEGGWHAQIAERSLRQPWFRAGRGTRAPIPGEAGRLGAAGAVPAAELRPGVMVRSLLQDWLLEPAAVVVGPGEFAYLRQLDPLYDHLGLARSPLVPRLGGWLLPPGLSPAALSPQDGAPAQGPPTDRLADDLAAGMQAALQEALAARLGLPAGRAAQLAAGRARRWRRGVAALLRSEAARVAASPRADLPPWVLPGGVRQERALAFVAALVVWGDPLLAAVQEAARMHLLAGADGHWQEFTIEVGERSKE